MLEAGWSQQSRYQEKIPNCPERCRVVRRKAGIGSRKLFFPGLTSSKHTMVMPEWNQQPGYQEVEPDWPGRRSRTRGRNGKDWGQDRAGKGSKEVVKD